jgi:ATP-binding cassette subfamily B protein
MKIGQVIACMSYLHATLMSLMMVSNLVIQVARAGASATRIQEVFETQPEIEDRPQSVREFAPRGRVAFENVSFNYAGSGGETVLRNVSFVAEPGQKVALLGSTGAGKSTLVHLIPRFYDVTEGRVTIDGTDVRDVEQHALRRAMGIALQETVLMSGTIRDNIRFARPEATDHEVEETAKAAQAHDFIVAFPDGYDTRVGQRGVNLSGGQRQRIAIARAFLARPALLILDDSTSSVDVETEAAIEDALGDMAKRDGRIHTVFVVAQRVSTVLNADKILVLDEGRIVAEGTHAELLASSAVYREIYESQLGRGTAAHA